MDEMVEAIQDYARSHYDSDGWDIIYECWEECDIARELKGCNTVDEAFAEFTAIAKMLGDSRRDIQAEIF